MKTSSFIVSVVLMVLILFNSTRTSLTYTYFELDPIGFIENLCENTDQPELACNGKCQLMKVAESQKNEQKTPESIIDFKELIFYPNPISEYKIPIETALKKQLFLSYTNLYALEQTYDCFHPPRV